MRNKELVKSQHKGARATRFAGGWSVFIPPHRTLGVGDTAAQAWGAAARSLISKSRHSVRSRVDQLIDWYDKEGKLDASIHVAATINTVRKFARKRSGMYRYRKRIIVPMRPVRTRAEIAAERECDINLPIND